VKIERCKKGHQKGLVEKPNATPRVREVRNSMISTSNEAGGGGRHYSYRGFPVLECKRPRPGYNTRVDEI